MAMLLARHRAERKTPLTLVRRQTLLDLLSQGDAEDLVSKACRTLPATLSAAPRSPSKAPDASMYPMRLITAGLAALGVIGVIVALWIFAPGSLFILPPLILAPVFILAAIVALTATIESQMQAPMPPNLTPPRALNGDLPRYTILVPLYHEAEIVPDLILRLNALDYPRHLLEIFLLVEAEDTETRAALQAITLPPFYLVLTVPPGLPRTKPRALNVALLFASGDYLVVYDAEDAPEPDQLLRAAALFAHSDIRTACIQARLAISNPRDGLLTRRFAIEYAALFDCMKAGAARLGWPVPLGGSSNHFRMAALKRIGGWDAWNVTEDADLGIRLARFGYHVQDLPSTTWEEAPNTLHAWMNQRTRWMKGWMQTLMVHARQPATLLKQLGAFQTMVIASTGLAVLIGALLYPVFIAALVYRFMSDVPLGGGSMLLDLADAMIIVSLIFALMVEIIPAWLAIGRRNALFLAPYIVLAPLSHALVSIAAWRALFEVMHRPYHWHKTQHGRAKDTGGLSSLDD